MKRFVFVMFVSLMIAAIGFLILDNVEMRPAYLEAPQTTMTPTSEPAVTQISLRQVTALTAAVEYTRYSTSWTYADLVNQLIDDGFTGSEAMYAADHCGLMG